MIVSGILLALSEIEHKNFDISDLIGDKIITDGSKIYKAIEDNLKRVNVSPEVKRDKLLNQFNIIKDNNKINEKNTKMIIRNFLIGCIQQLKKYKMNWDLVWIDKD